MPLIRISNSEPFSKIERKKSKVFRKKNKNTFRLKRYAIYLGYALVVLLSIYFLNINVKGIIVGSMLMIVGSFSKFYKQFTSASVGFELITPITILFAYKFGIPIAMVCAFIMLVAASVIAAKIDFTALAAELVDYLIVASVTVLLSTLPFIPVAIGMIVLRNILIIPLGVLIAGRHPFHMILVITTNIVSNVWLVIVVGDFFVRIL